jgi:hypothetical protein
MKPRIFGFSLLRNGIQYDYPFQESLSSLTSLSEKVYLALGKSADKTEETVLCHPQANKIFIIPTIWDENLRTSGIILSQQTNIALASLRQEQSSGWAIYLQADEVFSDHDFAKILSDIQKADEGNYDAVSFRYLHFWHAYDQIAYGPRWYPQEIRAIRIDSTIESYGDAQSFKNAKKIYPSDVAVFHYGHVREQNAYAKKQKEFHRWWHGDQELEKIWSTGVTNDRKEPFLRYLGPHATFMQDRIRTHSSSSAKSNDKEAILVWGNQADWKEIAQKISHKNVLWSLDPATLAQFTPERVVLLRQLSFFQKLKTGFKYKSNVPLKMLRKDARPWLKEFWAILKFSERGIRIKE